ncbi:MAG: NAD(P)-dependent oxidoreductase [Candidatus Omnitrophica bacterium]|nr:NAD(P)-dependent oxidoreductase [Candidatus Omnitrophota bacterium]
MRKNILITGASGLIGTALVDLFRNKEAYKIIGVYNNNKPVIEDKNIIYLQGELTQRKVWDDMKSLKIDALIHCAAKTPGTFKGEAAEESRLVNLEIDKFAISYARAENTKLIYISGTSVYGIFANKICDEDCETHPTGPYVKGKVESENEILSDKAILKYFILRVSAPYGPYQRSETVLKIFTRNALAGKPLIYYGTGQRTQDFTYVKDVARACLKAVENDNYGVYNIASGNSVSMKELAFFIKEITNSNSQIKASDKKDPQELYRPSFNISKAKKFLGWFPGYPLKEGLREFIEYIKENEL